MKKWYKKIAFLLSAAVLLLSGCADTDVDTVSVLADGQSDLEYVQSKGTFLVGITDFAPMDYRSGEEWTGFDAELSKAFAESIGVDVEFVEIDWDKKAALLENGSIDCIWNGMTMTDELKETVSCSEPYLSNAQVIVLQSEDAAKYSSLDSCQHLLFAVESSSAGEALLKEMKFRYSNYSTQKEALQSVSERKSDAAVIDLIMASYYTEKDEEFENLSS
ncbi:MAG: transporter substrate-binding domain-containing protein [Ruminiclostridium sp.]